LRRRGHDHRGGYMRYAAKASSCNECPLKSKCTKGPKGRWVSRSLEEEYLERLRAYRVRPKHTARPYAHGRCGWSHSSGRPRSGRVWGGSQAQGAREGELRGPHDRIWAKRQAAPSFREQSSEESGSGGGCATARSRPSGVSWSPQTSQQMHLGPSETFFNTLMNSANFAFTQFSEFPC
jgi:hypothetical protein